MIAFEDLPANIQERILPEPNTGCWLWVGWRTSGYGRLTVPAAGQQPYRQRLSLAHRWVYRLLVAENLPDSVDLLHSCDVRCCVNPAHLAPGGDSQNQIDACMRGGGRRTKLTPTAILEIRRRVVGGETQTAVGRSLGLHHSTVGYIARRDTWTQVEG